MIASFEFRQHPPGNYGLRDQRSYLLQVQPRHDGAICILHSWDVGEKNQCIRLRCDRACCRHLISVDVVILSVRAQRDAGDNWNTTLRPNGFEPPWLNRTDFSHITQVESFTLFLTCAKSSPVTATQSDGRLTCRSNRCHYILVHDASEHHQRHIPGFSIGDTQAIHEVSLLSHLPQGASQSEASTMNDGHAVTILRELNYRAGTLLQHRSILKGRPSDLDHHFQFRPSLSFHPHIRFMF